MAPFVPIGWIPIEWSIGGWTIFFCLVFWGLWRESKTSDATIEAKPVLVPIESQNPRHDKRER